MPEFARVCTSKAISDGNLPPSPLFLHHAAPRPYPHGFLKCPPPPRVEHCSVSPAYFPQSRHTHGTGGRHNHTTEVTNRRLSDSASLQCNCQEKSSWNAGETNQKHRHVRCERQRQSNAFVWHEQSLLRGFHSKPVICKGLTRNAKNAQDVARRKKE